MLYVETATGFYTYANGKLIEADEARMFDNGGSTVTILDGSYDPS